MTDSSLDPRLLRFAAAAALAAVHLFGRRLRFLDVQPRSRWLSAAGGVSVAYVFVHLLPELAAGQATLKSAIRGGLRFIEHHVYLVALTGLVIFYGVERLVRHHRHRLRAQEPASPQVFWLHIASFASYNGLIGYLLVHREDPGPAGLAWFTAAMLLHFLVTDFGLRQDHREAYDRHGRWVLAAALIGGWALGFATELPAHWIVVLTAFLAGGVILNVLKEELPEERESRFGAFLAGAGGYAALLLLL